jgi:hypothetical protein
MPNTKIFAGNVNLGTYPGVTQLYAGEAPIFTNDHEIAAGFNPVMYQVVAYDATGKAIAYDPAGAAPANVPAGIASAPGVAGDRIAFFEGGCFNHEVLVWPTALTTFEQRRAAVPVGSTLKIGRLVN